jgi:hypothetical protein
MIEKTIDSVCCGDFEIFRRRSVVKVEIILSNMHIELECLPSIMNCLAQSEFV